MVGRQVCQQRHVRRDVNLGQLLDLETRYLQDHDILGNDPVENRQERLVADVAAEPDLAVGAIGPCVFEQVCRQGSGRALAVGTGDADDAGGTQLEEDAHLRCHEPPLAAGGLQEGVARRHGRIGDDDIRLLEVGRVVSPQVEFDIRESLQLPDGISQLLPRCQVRDNHAIRVPGGELRRIEPPAKAPQPHD